MTRLKLSDFAVSLVGEEVVSPLSLEFEGADFCLIGERHAGKTPLMLALAGDLPHTGKMEIDGIDLSPLPAKEREVGAVFGARALFPGTVKDNLLYGLNLRGRLSEETEARAICMAKRLGVCDEQLSCPAKKADDLLALKTAFLRTLVRIPRMIVLDFPVRGEGKEDLALIFSMRELCREAGVLFLWLTESPAQAALFSVVCVLNRGRLVAFGTREELRKSSALSPRELLLLSPYVCEAFFCVSGGRMIFSGGNGCLLPAGTLPDGKYRAAVFEEDGFAFSSEKDEGALLAEVTYFERTEGVGTGENGVAKDFSAPGEKCCGTDGKGEENASVMSGTEGNFFSSGERGREEEKPFRLFIDLALGRAETVLPANAVLRTDKPLKEGVRTVFLRPLVENWNIFPWEEKKSGAGKAPKNKKKSRKTQGEEK